MLTSMEKKEIQFRLKTIKGITDFAKLLNDVKKDEFNSKKHPITEGGLLYFANSNIKSRYKSFHIRKKNGKLREINAPCYKLSIILNFINLVFKAVYTPNESVMGFTQDRSVVTNASLHIGHNYVFNIDLENFFSSISQGRVWARLQLPPFNLPKEVANVVAGICCNTNEDQTQNVLPQGAATSPLLTNAICDKLDRRMRGLAKRFGLHYSRYADDMTFSSMHNVYQEGSEFRNEVKRIIEEQGFKMNDSKTRLLKCGERQEVTGLTVNQKVNVTRKYVHDIRWLLHTWEKDGYGQAYAKFYSHYKRNKGYIKKGEPVMENVIGGKLNYMRMVKGEKNSTYCKLLERYNRLQTPLFVDNETDKDKSYIYVYSYSLENFEKYFNTKLALEISHSNKLIANCDISGMNKSMAISQKTQKYLCQDILLKQPGDIIDSSNLCNCFVTLCRSKGKNFWLITKDKMKRSKCLTLVNANIDIDNLLDIWEFQGINVASEILSYDIRTGLTMPVNKKLSFKQDLEEPEINNIVLGKIRREVSDNCFIDDDPFDELSDDLKEFL